MRKPGKLILTAILSALLIAAAGFAVLLHLRQFPFNNEAALHPWKEMILDGKVDYFIDVEDGNGFVHATSKNTCSALYYRIGFKPEEYPLLSWKWRVLKFPKKEAIEDASKDDYAIRVYAIFPSLFFYSSRFIEYIWAEHLPEGHVQRSPSGKNIVQIVVRSGSEDAGKWFQEERNVYEDYEKVFGKKASKSVGAIAIMCNSNMTESEAEALVDNITIGTKTI